MGTNHWVRVHVFMGAGGVHELVPTLQHKPGAFNGFHNFGSVQWHRSSFFGSMVRHWAPVMVTVRVTELVEPVLVL